MTCFLYLRSAPLWFGLQTPGSKTGRSSPACTTRLIHRFSVITVKVFGNQAGQGLERKIETKSRGNQFLNNRIFPGLGWCSIHVLVVDSVFKGFWWFLKNMIFWKVNFSKKSFKKTFFSKQTRFFYLTKSFLFKFVFYETYLKKSRRFAPSIKKWNRFLYTFSLKNTGCRILCMSVTLKLVETLLKLCWIWHHADPKKRRSGDPHEC